MQDKKAIQQRIAAKPIVVRTLIQDAFQCFVDGDIEASKEIIRECVVGTVGWKSVAETAGINEKSIIRMFSKTGNPSITNYSAVMCALADHNNYQVKLSVWLKHK